MRTGFTFSMLAAMVLIAGVYSPASAKEGPYIGVDLVYNSPGGDLSGDFEMDPGAGLDLKLGYIFAAPVAIEVEWGATGHDADVYDAGIGFLVFNFRYFFVTDQPLNPYFRFGIGRYTVVIEDVMDPFSRVDDITLTGDGFDIGLGFDYYINPNVTFGFGITQRFVEYDELDYLDYILIDDVNGDTTSINLGMQYHF